MATGSAPIPIGVTASFSNLQANVHTDAFTMSGGFAVVTFSPADVDNAGTLSLYDSGDNLILTMTRIGHTSHQVPVGGKSYYFSTTKGAAMVAMTLPNNLR